MLLAAPGLQLRSRSVNSRESRSARTSSCSNRARNAFATASVSRCRRVTKSPGRENSPPEHRPCMWGYQLTTRSRRSGQSSPASRSVEWAARWKVGPAFSGIEHIPLPRLRSFSDHHPVRAPGFHDPPQQNSY